MLAAHAFAPGMSLLHRSFRLASSDFEREQEKKAQSGEARTFRVLETAKGTLMNQCFEDVRQLMQICPPALPKGVPHDVSKVFAVSDD